jgi:hypothetical protein
VDLSGQLDVPFALTFGEKVPGTLLIERYEGLITGLENLEIKSLGPCWDSSEDF